MRKNAALFGVAFCALFVCNSFVFAQTSLDLKDPAYKNGVLQKIAGLVESKYVLADKAKGFADEFQAKCASGAYDSFTEAKEFAEKVTADLIAILQEREALPQFLPTSSFKRPAASPGPGALPSGIK